MVVGLYQIASGQVVIRGTVGGTRTIGPAFWFPGNSFVRVTDGRIRYIAPYRWWSFGTPIDGPYPPPTGPMDPRVMVGGVTGADGQPVPEPEPEAPPTPIEVAWAAMAAGHADDATSAFVEHLNSEPGDGEALRGFGFSLLLGGDAALAAGPVRTAYAMAPHLGMTPPSEADFGGRAEVRKLVVRAVRYGHEVGSASAWLVAAVLAQAEGRMDVAERFLGWAEAAGLEAETVRWMRTGFADAADRSGGG